jgi:hypothetical protein
LNTKGLLTGSPFVLSKLEFPGRESRCGGASPGLEPLPVPCRQETFPNRDFSSRISLDVCQQMVACSKRRMTMPAANTSG